MAGREGNGRKLIGLGVRRRLPATVEKRNEQ